MILLFFASSVVAQQEIPANLPTSVPTIPVKKPDAPLPPPVQPSFVPPTLPKPVSATADKPLEVVPLTQPNTKSDFPSSIKNAAESAADKAADLIANPQKIGDAIQSAPQAIPQQLQNVQERIATLRRDPNIFDGTNFEKLKWRNSLMFPQANLQALYNSAKGLTDQSVGAVVVEVKVPRTAPAFYLNSVLYNKPDNWTIWMNSRRIRSGAKFPELEISKVHADSVEFIWETDQLDFLSPNWEEKVPALKLEQGQEVPRFTYVSKDGALAVDRSRRFVRFTIGPHQTFISHEMKIVEGFAKSTFFETIERVVVPSAQGANTLINVEGQGVPPAALPTPNNAAPPVVAPKPAPSNLNPLNPLAPPSTILQSTGR